MAFMKPEYYHGEFITVLVDDEYEAGFPAEYYSKADWPKGHEVDREGGWYVRLSAPGYLDCTDWCGPFETKEEARREAVEQFEADPDTGELLDWA